MSFHHRRELIEQSFQVAEKTIGPVLDLGIGRFGYAYRDGMHTTLEDSTSLQEVESRRHQQLFLEASRELGRKADFSDELFLYQHHQHAWDMARNNTERLATDRVAVMSEWIDQHPRARPAVDEYCAQKAQQSLSEVAAASRPPQAQDEDLATPEQALAARQARYGRAM